MTRQFLWSSWKNICRCLVAWRFPHKPLQVTVLFHRTSKPDVKCTCFYIYLSLVTPNSLQLVQWKSTHYHTKANNSCMISSTDISTLLGMCILVVCVASLWCWLSSANSSVLTCVDNTDSSTDSMLTKFWKSGEVFYKNGSKHVVGEYTQEAASATFINFIRYILILKPMHCPERVEGDIFFVSSQAANCL